MALPVTIPNTFANATASIPLSQLDTNFNTLANAVNGISDGSESLANVSVTGGTISNVAVSATTLNTSGAVVFNDAGADVDFRVEGDTDANLLFVDASADKVGVGTTSLTYKLEVNGAIRGKEDIYVGRSSDNAVIGAISEGTSSGFLIESLAGGTDSTIQFKTSATERLRITSAGAVGIGTSSPSEKLHVNSGAGNIPLLLESTDAVVLCSFKDNSTTTDVAVGAQSDALVFYSGSERMRIDSSGNLLVGTTSAIAAGGAPHISVVSGANAGLRLQRTTDGGIAVFYHSAGTAVGSISVTSSATAYNTSSDYRLKENIAPMTGALAKVLELNPVTYTWKADGSAGQGFIAHELAEIVPDCVTGEKDETEIQQVEVSPAVPATYDDEGNELTPAVEAVYEEREVPVYQGVDTSFLVATLTAAIQELSAKNDALEARIAALENA